MRGYAAKTDAPPSMRIRWTAPPPIASGICTTCNFTGRTVYLAVVPDKAQFTVPPEVTSGWRGGRRTTSAARWTF